MKIARENNIKKGEKIIGQINSVIKSWNSYALQAKVRADISKKINENLNIFAEK